MKGIYADLLGDKGLQSSEKWYDMSREEQMEDALRRFKRYYDLHRQKYFDGYKAHYIPWMCIAFQGLVSIYKSGEASLILILNKLPCIQLLIHILFTATLPCFLLNVLECMLKHR